ncbi:MAG: tetraacyldisaccharide 4'-kinase, partial [Candidatus Omnitrophica bacterium]|nr:tetraacyldisaccharide 4'-kinase [Candidatus Omnitrophota bacterium]
YGGRQASPYTLEQVGGRLVVNGSPSHDGQALADEPRLLAQHLQGVPVFVGRRREQTGAQACREFKATVLILDDGFQYRRLHRECDIVLVNANMPLGGWPLFPRGPMRERLSALRRADLILVTKVDQALETVAALQERLKAYHPAALIASAVHEPYGVRDETTGQAVALDRLVNAPVQMASSIGDPEGFEETVRQLGATIVSHRRFPDHYAYTTADVRDLLTQAAGSGARVVVTTEKDAVRLAPFTGLISGAGVSLWVVQVRLRVINGESLIDDRLAAVLGR